jgi:hypothetical protein
MHTEEGRIEISLSALPPIARKKYRGLETLVTDAGALVKARMAQEREAETRIHALARRLRHTDPKDTTTVRELMDEYKEAGAEHQQIRDDLARRNSIRRNTEQILSQLKYNFLAADNCLGPWGCRAYSGPQAKPRASESLADAIKRVRTEIQQTEAQLAGVKATPPSVDEIKAAIVVEVNRMADEGKPTFTLDSGKVKFHWPDVQEFGPPGSALVAPSGGATKLQCWWDRDAMIQRLSAEAEVRGSDLSAAKRREYIADLAAQLARLEHEEEQLIEMALAAGVDVHRRPYASAYALLGIEPMSEADAAAAQAAAKAAAQAKEERVRAASSGVVK